MTIKTPMQYCHQSNERKLGINTWKQIYVKLQPFQLIYEGVKNKELQTDKITKIYWIHTLHLYCK